MVSCRTTKNRKTKMGNRTGKSGPPRKPTGQWSAVYASSCAIADCQKVSRNRGYCVMHYARLLRNGDPLVRTLVTSRPCVVCETLFIPHHKQPNAQTCSI